jgi:hypothetical protein
MATAIRARQTPVATPSASRSPSCFSSRAARWETIFRRQCRNTIFQACSRGTGGASAPRDGWNRRRGMQRLRSFSLPRTSAHSRSCRLKSSSNTPLRSCETSRRSHHARRNRNGFGVFEFTIRLWPQRTFATPRLPRNKPCRPASRDSSFHSNRTRSVASRIDLLISLPATLSEYPALPL